MTQHRGTRGGKQTRGFSQRMEEITQITIKPRIARGFISMMTQEAKHRGITWNQLSALVIEEGIKSLRRQRQEQEAAKRRGLALVKTEDDPA